MHTNETVNYKLSQFVGTDIPNPLVDYNGDMEKIDIAIKNVADSAVVETDRITALETQNGSEALETTAQTLSGAANELHGETGALDVRLTTVEGKLITDESTLATAVGNISTLAGKTSALETKVGSAVLDTVAQDLSDAVNELKNEIDGSGGATTSLAARVTALEAQNGNEVLVTTAQTLSGAINELAGGTGAITAANVTYDNTTSGLSATDVQDAIDEICAKSEKVSGTLAAGSTSLTLTFTSVTVGASTLIDWFVSDPSVSPTAISVSGNAVTFTFESQSAALTVAAKAEN